MAAGLTAGRRASGWGLSLISGSTVAGGVYYFNSHSSFLQKRPLRADSSRSFSFGPNGTSDKDQTLPNSSKSGQPRLPKSSKSGDQEPPPQNIATNEDNSGEDKGWTSFVTSISSVKWASIPDMITGLIVPDWLKLFPAFMNKFQNELSMAPGSLAEEIWREANDPEVNPEIMWDANVRISDDICEEEKAFLASRKQHTVKALAKYLNLPEHEIHPDDVPTIAMCGSGGGLRALVAGSGSYLVSKESGLFDCITYTAGVSGSCWLQTLYYSSMGQQSHEKLINHLKNRLGVHMAYPPSAFGLINSAPTNKFLLSGLVEKLKGMPDADFGIVDMYGMLLASRLLVPKGELGVDMDDLKLSTQQKYVNKGQNPFPLYSCVRHEIPIEEAPLDNGNQESKKDYDGSWFQWFEFSPYEMFSEDLGAGIPIWAVGREFKEGKTVWRRNGLALPETRIPILLGIWGSAFCATLSHYYREIRPIMQGLAGFSGVDGLISSRDDALLKVHPISAASIPSFAVDLFRQFPANEAAAASGTLLTAPKLELMDAGMSNNLPIYCLLRPSRKVDVIVAFDSSADVRTDNWLSVVDGYAVKRGIRGWPIGAGWPKADEAVPQTEKELSAAIEDSKENVEQHIEEVKRDDAGEQKKRPEGARDGDLGYCNVWVGSTTNQTRSSRLSEKWENAHQLESPDAGITVVYFPLLTNDKVRGVDPAVSDYLSTWNMVYTPEQIDNVVSLARANYDEGKEQTKRAIRAVYERKKKLRLEQEKRDKASRKSKKMRLGIPKGRKLGEGDHGDQFS
ncbi:cytosolic phospholipase A2 zeta [Microthyrium microscopicum]|uniref:Lysophospholipase n=1 Tax=Microthyrium microscopicum TaxID=703497 RepID=A0A6A6U9D7_9PEZI|nr:cytosolic phospholipase A2 zeta [Microthyrium microscopicum]